MENKTLNPHQVTFDEVVKVSELNLTTIENLNLNKEDDFKRKNLVSNVKWFMKHLSEIENRTGETELCICLYGAFEEVYTNQGVDLKNQHITVTA